MTYETEKVLVFAYVESRSSALATRIGTILWVIGLRPSPRGEEVKEGGAGEEETTCRDALGA